MGTLFRSGIDLSIIPNLWMEVIRTQTGRAYIRLMKRITILNPENGWIQNCNSTPFTAAAEYSPKVEDYPTYMSRNRENFRGIHAIRLLSEPVEYTLDKLLDTAYDPFLPGFEDLIPGLIEAIDQNKVQSDMAEAAQILRDWDFSVSQESVGMSLAHFYALAYNQKGEAPEGLNDIDRYKFFSTQTDPQERIAIFREVLDKLTADFGSWNTPWGEINRFQRTTGDIIQPFDDSKPSLPVGLASGRWGALASYGARTHNGSKKIYGTSGNSFVAVVEFGDKVKAKSMLAGGQSGDPNSSSFL